VRDPDGNVTCPLAESRRFHGTRSNGRSTFESRSQRDTMLGGKI
jgi:hypothetical protein